MDEISQIKHKLNIADVVSAYVSLKKSGKNYKGVCPFHSEKTPSFMVSPELQLYKCFGCGEGGDMFTFVQKIEGIEFFDALKILAEKAGVEIDKEEYRKSDNRAILFEINALAAKFYIHLLRKHPVGKNAMSYLIEKRKLKETTLDAFLVGYAPDKWDTLYNFLLQKGYKEPDIEKTGLITRSSKGNFIDKFRGRIVFPLVDITGKIVGFTARDLVGRDPKYLNSPESAIFDKSAFLYGLNKAKVAIKHKGALLVEGQVDVLKAFQNGIDNVIATSGTSLTEKHLKIISRYTDKITLCFDPDEAGQKAMERAIELAEGYSFEITVAQVPDKYADFDELLNADLQGAKDISTSPVPVYDFYFAVALRKFDKATAYGKKSILEYFLPKLEKSKSNFVKEHYIKKMASELDISEESIRNGIQNNSPVQVENTTNLIEDNTERSLEKHFFRLVFKSSIDTIGSVVYKLEASDFISPEAKTLFIKLKEYLASQPESFDIKFYSGSLDADLGSFAVGLYLSDLQSPQGNQKTFDTELNATFSRIRRNAVKRELKYLTGQMKLAELEKDRSVIDKLAEKINTLTKELSTYEK